MMDRDGRGLMDSRGVWDRGNGVRRRRGIAGAVLPLAVSALAVGCLSGSGDGDKGSVAPETAHGSVPDVECAATGAAAADARICFAVPRDGAEGVATEPRISVKFNVDVEVGDLMLTPAFGSPDIEAGAAEYDSGRRLAQWTPGEPLAEGEVYSAQVDYYGGGGEEHTFEWSFTIKGEYQEPVEEIVLTGATDIMQMHFAWDGTDEVDLFYSSDPDCDWDNHGACEDSGAIMGLSGGEHTLKAVADGLDPDTGWYFVAEAGGARSNQVGARPIPPVMVGSEGIVHSVLVDGGNLYVGGDFSSVSTYTGGGATLSKEDGRLLGPVPRVEGGLSAVEPDGRGGWYIGGMFWSVGGVERYSLARIRPDGSVDPDWNPGAGWGSGPEESVESIRVVGDRVYVAGHFSEIAGEGRGGLAAFDAETGELLDWDAGVEGGAVYVLAASEDTLYIGGYFTTVGGEPRERLAAFDIADGSLLDWNPGADHWVFALAVHGDTLYAGGRFEEAGGEPRSRLAAFDAVDGSLREWDPGAGGQVSTLLADGERLYAGGWFEEVGGEERQYLVAFDAEDGELLDWNPAADGRVLILTLGGGTLFVGGTFDHIAGEERQNLAAFSVDDGLQLTDWNPGADDCCVYALAASGDRVYAGGAFSHAGGVRRESLAAFDAEDGTLTGWNPDVVAEGPGVTALAASDGRIYAGGEIEAAGGEPRGHLAAFDAESGELVAWDAAANDGVASLVELDGLVYASGPFTEVGDGIAREGLAAFDAGTGEVVEWVPDMETEESFRAIALVAKDDKIYAGGFSMMGRLGAFPAGMYTGGPEWAHNVSGPVVLGLAVAGDRLYAWGLFSAVYESEREGLAAFDLADGALSEWSPAVEVGEGGVTGITAAGGRIFVGGDFEAANGQSKDGLAAFDADTGDLVSGWEPSLLGGGGVSPSGQSMSASGDRLYIGGSFTRANEKLRRGLAVFDTETGELVW